jgi:hypothetical protein
VHAILICALDLSNLTMAEEPDDEVLPTDPHYAALQEKARENAEASRPEVDTTYHREVVLFQKYVDANDELLAVDGKYVTESNVNSYFTHVVALKTILPSGAKRIVNAIDKHAKDVEYTDGTVFKCGEMPLVVRALDNQKNVYKHHAETVIYGDPHGKLSIDILKDSDHVDILTYNYNSTRNWRDFGFTWTAGFQTYIRTDSAIKLCLPDIVVRDTHGPVAAGPNARMVIYILRKARHKTRDKVSKVVGSWRHKNYLRDNTGHLAANLMVRFHETAQDVNFFRGVDGKNPAWWTLPIITGWDGQRQAGSVFKAVLDACNVSWAKVTHLRTAGMEFSSSQGELQSDEIATMSKHLKEKIFAYLTDLLKPVLRVMSGHAKDAEYYVPRTNITFEEFGLSSDEITALIFPMIETWRDQQQSAEGDKSAAAGNFLNKTLPFLAEVIIQDGVFWTRDFPHHEISTILLEKMQGLQNDNYEAWATRKQAWCEERDSVIRDSGSTMNVEMIRMRTEMENMRTQHAQETIARSAETAELRKLLNSISTDLRNLTLLPVRQSQLAILPAGAAALAPPLPLPAAPPPAAPPPALVTPLRQAPLRQVAIALRRTAGMPNIPTAMPRSMATFMSQFEGSKLEDWIAQSTVATRKVWPPPLRNRFSKWVYLHAEVQAKASRLRRGGDAQTSIRRAVAVMQADMTTRGKLNTSQYFAYLKSIDPRTKKRVRAREREV